jgi:hypothetical protein
MEKLSWHFPAWVLTWPWARARGNCCFQWIFLGGQWQRHLRSLDQTLHHEMIAWRPAMLQNLLWHLKHDQLKRELLGSRGALNAAAPTRWLIRNRLKNLNDSFWLESWATKDCTYDWSSRNTRSPSEKRSGPSNPYQLGASFCLGREADVDGPSCASDIQISFFQPSCKSGTDVAAEGSRPRCRGGSPNFEKTNIISLLQFSLLFLCFPRSTLGCACLCAGIYDNIAPGKSMQNWIEVGIGKQQVVLGLLCRAYQTSPVWCPRNWIPIYCV